MKKMIINILAAATVGSALSGCGTLFDKDNTPPPSPLVKLTPAINIQTVWSTNAGSGSESEYLKLTPSITADRIYTSSKDGIIASVDKTSGKIAWKIHTPDDLSNGITASNGMLFVGTRKGNLLALNQTNGSLVWKVPASSEMLAPAAATQQIVLIKTIDGRVTALSQQDGHALWHYQETEPSLVLRGSSAPQITNNSVIVGFENGGLVKLSLQKGSVAWKQAIAQPEGVFAIQRMIDVDADPIIVGNRVIAATYQGRIAALNLADGNELWSHDISSYSGIASNGSQVYVSDAAGRVWAFDVKNGNVDWQQNQLLARNITGPALLGNYIVVGDAEGYLHWLDKQDGHFVARTFVNKSGIIAAPLADNNTLYVYTKNGRLTAYKIL